MGKFQKKNNFCLTKTRRTDLEIEALQQRSEKINSSEIKTFWDFPLSENTKKGLREAKYKIPTEIQRECIGLGLQGRDILGAAETGSGKTLAFLIPVLEVLFVKKWTRQDGMGAMIITPTRELAYQIFETLKKVGSYHDFSAGLIIGGKDLHFEKERMDQCNIVICTPGRILHHMDMNPLFDSSNLQILVLDEADRCLDMGFEKTMNAIIEHLPSARQTLLFSATQTKSVKDLGRLSLKTPAYVSVHENKKHTTPDALEQSYVVCPLEDKINFIWSFIKNHRRQKILIFLSSCKQVKYIYSLFCQLRPGTPLLALYGTLHQLRRMKIYNDFCSKQNVVMFATDIAARGLDFPEVNWVVQLDCPEDATTYIHRAGRTARYSKEGESLLVLLPSEEDEMVKELEAKRVPISKIEVNRTKLMTPLKKIEALLAANPELKADAQRCFLAYIKSVYLMKNKNIFNIEAIDLEKYAASLGLAVTPRVRFLKGKMTMPQLKSEDDNNEEKEVKSAFAVDNDFPNAENDDDFLTLKRQDHDISDEYFASASIVQPPNDKKLKKAIVTKAAAAKKILKKNIVANKKIVYADNGKPVEIKGKEKFTEEGRAYENEDSPGIDIIRARQILRAEDKFDKKLFMKRVKQKHKEKKKKLKNSRQLESSDEEEDKFNVRLSCESDEESLQDLSWIPDPDKFSCRQNIQNDSEDCSDIDEKPEVTTKLKKRLNNFKKTREKKKIKVEHDKDGYSTGLSLQEDEEIALRILQSSKDNK